MEPEGSSHHFLKSQLLIPTLDQKKPAEATPSCLLIIHFNVILILGLPDSLFYSGFPTKILYTLEIKV
jgi:hypothetical protein